MFSFAFPNLYIGLSYYWILHIVFHFSFLNFHVVTTAIYFKPLLDHYEYYIIVLQNGKTVDKINLTTGLLLRWPTIKYSNIGHI